MVSGLNVVFANNQTSNYKETKQLKCIEYKTAHLSKYLENGDLKITASVRKETNV